MFSVYHKTELEDGFFVEYFIIRLSKSDCLGSCYEVTSPDDTNI